MSRTLIAPLIADSPAFKVDGLNYDCSNGTGWHESDINRWIADPSSWRPKREFDET